MTSLQCLEFCDFSDFMRTFEATCLWTRMVQRSVVLVGSQAQVEEGDQPSVLSVGLGNDGSSDDLHRK